MDFLFWWLAREGGRLGVYDAIMHWIAYRLSKRIVYWVLIRAGVQTIKNDEVIPAVPFMVVLQRWGR